MRALGTTLAAILVSVCSANVGIATAQYDVIYTFNSTDQNLGPVGTLRADLKGNLFGDSRSGDVFELSPDGHGGWIEKTIPNGPGGSEWIPDAKGNVYAAVNCGVCTTLSGEIIEASPAPGGVWHRKTIYSFGSHAADGVQPSGSLVLDTEGNLYGTTQSGGTYAAGTVFELTPSANGPWTEKVLYSFGVTPTDAINPAYGLTIDPEGNLYGTANGGPFVYANFYNFYVQGGTVFKLTKQANSTWSESIIYAFTPATPNDFGYLTPVGVGWNPYSTLILDNKGNLFGTTAYGLSYDGPAPSDTISEGTVYKLSPGASGWNATFTTLVCENEVFCFTDGNLTMDTVGNVYGTTIGGGSNLGVADGSGDTAFEVDAQAQESVLHNFPAYQTDGNTSGGLTSLHGKLYGITFDGGPTQEGTVYEIQGVASTTPVGTTTALVATPGTNLVAGEPIVLTATVSSDSGSAIPTGTVTFTSPAGGSVTALLVAGKAVYSGKVPPAGTYTVYATYSGDGSFAGSKSTSITESVTAP